MVLLSSFAAISAGLVQPAPPARPEPSNPHSIVAEQATATVRIVAGVRITPGKRPETAMTTETKVRGPEGGLIPARLTEFP